MRKILSLLFLFVAVTAEAAVVVTAKAPASVGVGSQFRLQYTVNSADVNGHPQIGNIAGFDIVYGPAVSTSQSVQI